MYILVPDAEILPQEPTYPTKKVILELFVCLILPRVFTFSDSCSFLGHLQGFQFFQFFFVQQKLEQIFQRTRNGNPSTSEPGFHIKSQQYSIVSSFYGAMVFLIFSLNRFIYFYILYIMAPKFSLENWLFKQRKWLRILVVQIH